MSRVRLALDLSDRGGAVWVHDPDRIPWEVCTALGDAPEPDDACC